MQNLIIEKTKTTPQVNFNAATGSLEIAGESYPENAMQIYQPILDWLKNFTSTTKNKIVFNFKLSYFNTSSSKCIFNIMELLEEAVKAGSKVEINWCYAEDDEDM